MIERLSLGLNQETVQFMGRVELESQYLHIWTPAQHANAQPVKPQFYSHTNFLDWAPCISLKN